MTAIIKCRSGCFAVRATATLRHFCLKPRPFANSLDLLYIAAMASFKESAQSLLSEVAGVFLRRSRGDSKDEQDFGRHQEVCHCADPDVGMIPWRVPPLLPI